VRVTALDECGRPVYAEESPGIGELPLHVVSDGVISLGYEDENEDGDEFIQKNGWGELCVNEMGNSVFKRANVTISFCNVDPELFSIVLGTELILNGAGDAIGYSKSEGLLDHGFALEGWAGVAGVECTAENIDYGYVLFPFITDGKLSSAVTFENGNTTFEMTGFTRPGVAWGVGPYDVQSDYESPSPGFGPLDPAVGSKEHYRKFISNAPIPTASCGIAA
jgi:hypothetical protein